MRQALVNENPGEVEKNRKYIMRITGDDAEGKAELDNFIDPEQPYPVITTTSELMTTGVDAKTCKLIVLDQRIQSMTKFKQVIGRGTRIDEDYNKLWFTIMDFKKATELFADQDFDGEPVVVYNPTPGGSTVPGDGDDGGIGTGSDDGDDGEGSGYIKYVVKGVDVHKVAERTQYYSKDGKLITESIKDYTKQSVSEQYRTLNDFIRKWDDADQKQAIIQELEEQGVIWEALEEEVGKEYEPFDLICHVVFDQPPLTRKERAENVRKRNYFTKYGDEAKQVLEALLDKYADEGVSNIESMEVLKVQPINELGSPFEIIKAFGGKKEYESAIRDLESMLYKR